ncbi:MAG: GntR family transcriptional regulator, partial [Hafnia sp.]
MAASYEFLFVDPSSKEPLYRQIYQRIKSAIADGVLSSGERLPSLRGLASDLNVARGTVEAAYALLSGEGYIENSGQGGTRVSLRLIAPKLTETSKKLAEMPRHAGMPLPS